MKWFILACRNTLRNRRRSVVAMSITLIGTGAILLACGFALYTYEALAQSAARNSGHLILATPKMFSDEESVSMEFGLEHPQEIAGRLMADRAVRAVLPQVDFGGLLSNGDKSVVMFGVGVEPDSEFRVKGPFLKIVSGDVLSGEAEQPGALVGEGLARSLRLQVGSGVTALSTTSDGSMNAIDLVVEGIFSTGVPDVDRRLVYVDLREAQKMLKTDRVSRIGVFLARMEDTADAQTRARSAFPNLAVRTWQDEAFFYTSVRDLYNRIFGSLGAIIAVIVFFVVGNAMSMSIVERTRELSTLRAIGTLESLLIRMLAFEGLMLGSVGALAGAALSAAISVLLDVFPIQMPPPPGRSQGYPLSITVDPLTYIGVVIGMVALATAVSAIVARKTVNIAIPDGLAHT